MNNYECKCGKVVKIKSLNKHKNSKRHKQHIEFMNNLVKTVVVKTDDKTATEQDDKYDYKEPRLFYNSDSDDDFRVSDKSHKKEW